MTITLRPELEAMIREDVARGGHDSVEQFVEAAVLSLHARTSFMVTNDEEMRSAIEEGWLSARTEPLYTEAESRALLAEHKAASHSDRAHSA